MSDLVQLTTDNGIAIITINNPPVNALSPGVPEGIAESIEKINQDPSIEAAVLIGGGRTFIAGADIKEFGKITSGKNAGTLDLPTVLLRIEDSRKPVVMAIHGTAFGGGLEVAMAGHYRVATPGAQVGPTRSKTRNHPRRSWHAAPTASSRHRRSSRNVRRRQSHQNRRSRKARHSGSSNRRRSAERRGSLRP